MTDVEYLNKIGSIQKRNRCPLCCEIRWLFPSASSDFFNIIVYEQRLKKETCNVYLKIKIGHKARKLGSFKAKRTNSFYRKKTKRP